MDTDRLRAAIEEEHAGICRDQNTCDISKAFDEGLYLWSAHMLIGATECSLTEAAYVALEPTKERAAYSLRHGLPYPFKASTADWIYLGGCGWYGQMDEARMAEVKAFLETHKADVPGWPEEWVDLKAPAVTVESVQEVV